MYKKLSSRNMDECSLHASMHARSVAAGPAVMGAHEAPLGPPEHEFSGQRRESGTDPNGEHQTVNEGHLPRHTEEIGSLLAHNLQ